MRAPDPSGIPAHPCVLRVAARDRAGDERSSVSQAWSRRATRRGERSRAPTTAPPPLGTALRDPVGEGALGPVQDGGSLPLPAWPRRPRRRRHRRARRSCGGSSPRRRPLVDDRVDLAAAAARPFASGPRTRSTAGSNACHDARTSLTCRVSQRRSSARAAAGATDGAPKSVVASPSAARGPRASGAASGVRRRSRTADRPPPRPVPRSASTRRPPIVRPGTSRASRPRPRTCFDASPR